MGASSTSLPTVRHRWPGRWGTHYVVLCNPGLCVRNWELRAKEECSALPGVFGRESGLMPDWAVLPGSGSLWEGLRVWLVVGVVFGFSLRAAGFARPLRHDSHAAAPLSAPLRHLGPSGPWVSRRVGDLSGAGNA